MEALVRLSTLLHGCKSWCPWVNGTQRRSWCSVLASARSPATIEIKETCSFQALAWTDEFRWMQEGGQKLRDHLSSEHMFTQHFWRKSSSLQQLLQKEMIELCPPEVVTYKYEMLKSAQKSEPVQLGAYQYRIRQSASAPLSKIEQISSNGTVLTVLDSNALAQEYGQAVEVGQVRISRCQTRVAYTLDHSHGGEDYQAYVKDIASGQVLDIIDAVTAMEWQAHDVLLYTTPDSKGRPDKVYRHTIGSESFHRTLLFTANTENAFLELTTTKSGAFILVNANCKSSSEVYLLDPFDPVSRPVLIEARTPGLTYFVEHHGTELLLLVHLAGWPDYQLMHAPICRPNRSNWRTVLSHRPGVSIVDMDVLHGHCVLYERHRMQWGLTILPLPDALSHQRHSQPQASGQQQPTGTPANGAEALEEVATARTVMLSPEFTDMQPQISADPAALSIHVTVSSPTQPPQILTFDLISHQWQARCLDQSQGTRQYLHELARTHLQYTRHTTSLHSVAAQMLPRELRSLFSTPSQPSWHTSVQFVPNKDGLEVPLTLSHVGDLQPDSARPALVVVYAAYGTSLDAGWELQHVPLLARGWIVCHAHVRGGGELGKLWHSQGANTCKMNGLDDLNACMDHLLSSKLTSAGNIVIQAFSAGGVLAGALLNARCQDLAAAVLRAPFVDMLSTMTNASLPLTVHEYDEWGNPDDADGLQSITRACPYYNIKPSRFPAVLVTCASNDKRVAIWGPAKWVARLRANQLGHSPILLSPQQGGGHFGGAGSEVNLAAEELAFILGAVKKEKVVS